MFMGTSNRYSLHTLSSVSTCPSTFPNKAVSLGDVCPESMRMRAERVRQDPESPRSDISSSRRNAPKRQCRLHANLILYGVAGRATPLPPPPKKAATMAATNRVGGGEVSG